jgi:2-C-methyl-D-erythritol 2,4-cyclodiphosphate synthase
MRIGIGHDTHRLIDGGPLRLGGITVAHNRHLVGHSDADVLLHAVTDALLGAVAAGDIGELFPDTDERHHGQDSKEFLLEALRRVHRAGYHVANLDVIVFAERPKLSPYKELIRRQLADWLEIDVSAVSVKAKTGEAVGPIGREEAIAAEAIVLLLRPSDVPSSDVPG